MLTGSNTPGIAHEASTALADRRFRGAGRAENHASPAAQVDRRHPQAPVPARAHGLDHRAEAAERAGAARHPPERRAPQQRSPGLCGVERERRDRREGRSGKPRRAAGRRGGSVRAVSLRLLGERAEPAAGETPATSEAATIDPAEVPR